MKPENENHQPLLDRSKELCHELEAIKQSISSIMYLTCPLDRKNLTFLRDECIRAQKLVQKHSVYAQHYTAEINLPKSEALLNALDEIKEYFMYFSAILKNKKYQKEAVCRQDNTAMPAHNHRNSNDSGSSANRYPRRFSGSKRRNFGAAKYSKVTPGKSDEFLNMMLQNRLFKSLYEDGHTGDYAKEGRSGMTFVNLLMHFCEGDKDLVDYWFRRSALYGQLNRWDVTSYM